MTPSPFVLRQFTRAIGKCPRCPKTHHMETSFYAFARPFVDASKTEWQFWGTCNETNAPVLARVRFRPGGTWEDGGWDFVIEGEV